MEAKPAQLRPIAAKRLSATNLINDFGAKAQLARRALDALRHAILETNPSDLDRWAILIGRASGHDPAKPSPPIDQLAAAYGLAAAGHRPDATLFALHTYFALVVKLLANHVLAADSDADSSAVPFHLPAEPQLPPTQRTLPPASDHDDPFTWCSAGHGEAVGQSIRALKDRVAAYDPASLPNALAEEGDLLGQLYQAMFPRAVRHALGEYYTPGWLADHVLDAAGYSGEPAHRLLDPACGSGAFLLAAIRRIRRWYETGGEHRAPNKAGLLRQILRNVVGFELNPLAVVTARANYLFALGDLREAAAPPVPVRLADSILDASPTDRFDFVVGNPPWVAWDNLPADYRDATKPLWQRYGLFSLSGTAARHGGAKKDLAMLMVYASADRFLDTGGRLAMVVTQTLLQSKGAGDGFRRFRLGDQGEPLKVLRVDDLVALRPFREAANFTSVVVLSKGEPTAYPIPYFVWSPESDTSTDHAVRTCLAEPIDPQRANSPWFIRPEGFRADLAQLIAPSDYQAHIGANTGGANGVYWLEILASAGQCLLVRNLAAKGRDHLHAIEVAIEAGLLHPLLRWGDLARYRAQPSAHILLAQDPATRTGIDPNVMRREYPKTLEYLERHEPLLRRRAAFRQFQQDKPFYSMYNVGTYTLAPTKVVWRRMDRRMNAAVVETSDHPLLGPRPVVPQETCVLIDTRSADEAHYVCAVLNSAVVDFLIRAHSVCGGKGFGTPSMLDFIKLRRFDPRDDRHRELAQYSRDAHASTARGHEPIEPQCRIDRLAARLWGLDEAERAAIESSRGI